MNVVIYLPWINTGCFPPSSPTARYAEHFVAELGCLFDVAALLVLGVSRGIAKTIKLS